MNDLKKMLLAHVSKDETRIALSGVHFTHDGRFAEATDGHRYIKVSLESCVDLAMIGRERAGKIYSFTDHTTLDVVKYPNCDSFLPRVDETWTKVAFEFPAWFKGIKTKKTNKALFIDALGVHLSRPPKDCGTVVAIDAEYLAPYAGIDCEIAFKNPLSPIRIVGKHDENQQWMAVVMPIRA